jgi:hypothetical protein
MDKFHTYFKFNYGTSVVETKKATYAFLDDMYELLPDSIKNQIVTVTQLKAIMRSTKNDSQRMVIVATWYKDVLNAERNEVK